MPDAASTTLDDRAVGVVVCTRSFERLPILVALLDSLAAGQRRPDETIVVVDRNPSLLTQLRSRTWPLPVAIMPSDGNGLAAARNTGWRAAKAEHIAFIDDDAVASPGWLAELVAAARNQRAGVVGGRIDAEWVGGPPRWFDQRLGWVVGCSYDAGPSEPVEVRNVIGCNMLISRDVLARLGGFDASFGRMAGGNGGCEETELCIRAGALGVRVILVPGAAVAQVLPQPRKKLSNAVRRGWDEGRSKRALVAKHGSVLGTEGRYTRDLVQAIVTRAATGLLRLNATMLQQATAMALVLAATAISFGVHALIPPKRPLLDTQAPASQ